MLRRDPALAELVAELLRVLTAWQWRRAPSAVGPRLPDLRDPATWQAAVAAAAPLTLLQIIRLVGKQPLVVPPVPPLPLVVRVAALAGWTCPSLRHLWPSGAAFLRYACVADTRRVAAELGWQPAWCARMLVEEVAGAST